MPEVLIPIAFFSSVFGMVYLFYTTRNKERLALIEKGTDANIFVSDKKSSLLKRKIFILNLAVFLMGIGIGIFTGYFLTTIGMEEGVAYPGSIFFISGLSLLVGFKITDKTYSENK